MAETISTLERIGDKLAQGVVVNVLTPDASNLPLPPFGPRSTEKLGKNRISVRGGGFVRASDQMNLAAGGYYYNHRRGRLSFEIVTQRQGQTSVGPDARHGVAIGRIRWLMSRIAQKLIPANVGTYEILDVIDLGESYLAHEETETDRTTVDFEIVLVIPPGSYTDS